MKILKINLLLCLAVLLMQPHDGCATNSNNNTQTSNAQSNKTFIYHPVDHGKALINPGMGWTMHFYSNLLCNYGSKLEAEDTIDDFPGVSTVYLRIPWRFVEPEEGKFNWEVLDTPAQRWIQKGKKVAFRITSTENWMHQGTPQWVFDAGAKYYEVNNFLEPEYDDPIFLQKVENFIKKMAERYDNNPNVAFVDVGHFGMWGEGHTVNTTPFHGHSWGIETQKKYIDLYCKYFKNTLLCISDDYAGDSALGARFPITDYAFSKGVSIRDDSILVQPKPKQWFHSEMAQLFWPTLPVILEHEHYESAVKVKSWDEDLLLQSIEDYHASYMSIHTWPRLLLNENRDVIDKINRRLGYRIQLNEIEWPKKVKKNEVFSIRTKWRNAGVAPCYDGGYPCFTIKNEKGGIISVLVDTDFNVKTLPVSEPNKMLEMSLTSDFMVAKAFEDPSGLMTRSCRPGKYTLYVSVGSLDGTPIYELPYESCDGHKRYKVGTITVTE